MIGFAQLDIRAKLLVVISGITFTTLVLATTAHILYNHHATKQRLVAEQQALARVIADRSTAALAFADERVATENLAALAATESVEAACIYAPDGTLFAVYSRQPGTLCSAALTTSSKRAGRGSLALAQPIVLDKVPVGTLTLRSGLADLTHQTRANLLVGVAILAGALLLATLAAAHLQRLVSTPIVRLAETAGHITRTRDYQVRAEAGSRDEVGQLVDAFNRMLEAIRERDNSLQRSEARFRTLVEGIAAILYTTEVGADAATLYISPQLERILGFRPNEWMRRPELFREQLHGEDRERVMAQVADCQRLGVELECEYRMLHRDGQVVWIRDEARVVRDANGRPMLMQGLRYDISERKQAEARIEHLAYHDALTDLANRRLFKDRLAETLDLAARYGTRFALHFLDLDHFKDINDSLGHPVGDALLVAVAERLLGVARRSDSLARLGGDEFAAIQYGVLDARDASRMAQRYIEALRAPFLIGDARIRVGTCVGVVMGEAGGLDAEALMAQADVALYKAKEAGANSFAFYEDSMTAALQREMALADRLPEAIAGGELYLEYQPQVELHSRRLVGLEVLARWHHPEQGLVMPVEFIGIAEKRGLVAQLGAWVLDQACRQLAQWRARGSALPSIAVNISPVQLRTPGFAEMVLDIIDKNCVPTDAIELEFTESVFLAGTPENLAVIDSLSARGVRFAIDDFGTGFSSLAYLRKFQVDTLKIDRTFIMNMVERPSDAELVRAAIALGRALGLATIAEGVETEAQAAMLGGLGCVRGQGYLFGRPMSAEAISTRLDGMRVAEARVSA